MSPISIDERKRVNHELRKMGFGGLDDPNLIAGIAFCIRDHEHFRNQLFSVKPEERRHAYNTLRPHLRFAAKPLDVYEAEMKDFAERMQLPGYNKETGDLIPFKAGSVELDRLATDAIRQNKHEKHGGLWMTCAKCTVVEIFRAPHRKEAEREAEQSGWRSDGEKNWCPKHVPTRCTMTLRCSADNCLVEEKIRAWDPQDGYASARVRGWVIGDAAYCPKCSAQRLTLQ